MKAAWVYYVSRDSINGELSGTCSLWYAKPVRVKRRNRVTWEGASTQAPCFLGNFTPENVAAWFRVYPETDLELLRVEQTPTAKMLAASRRQAR